MLDAALLLFGLAVGVDFRHIPSHVHAIMRIAWTRMGEQGGFSGLARIHVVLGAIPFSIVRVYLVIIGVGGGILALIIGPH
jgi:hypothetical protein